MAKKVKIERRNNSGIILALFLLFGGAMMFISYYAYNYVTPTDKFFSEYNNVINNELANIISNQEKTDEELEKISNDRTYNLANPFVTINPYGISPLSSLIIFQTDEELSVDLYINDEYVTTIEKSKKHIIPVYGLYANSKNIVELKMSDGTSNSVEIITKPYNDELNGIKIGKMKNNERYFLLGNILDNESVLRGFDEKNNLMFYLNLYHLNGVKYHYNRFYVSYNSKNSKELLPIKIEFDFLGRIYSIGKNVSDINVESNIGNSSAKYIFNKIEMYKKSIENYSFKKYSKDTNDIKPLIIKTKEIENELDKADVYDNYFNVSINGDYLSYYFKENLDLVLINKNSDKSYIYSVNDQGIIKIDYDTNDLALYVKINDKYYNLLTTLKK